jgi:uncharacterized protein with PQ loop repeat|tara:strand:+ start:1543 stop:1794 length:252 start_codon:yes stop_codon:yes gene_type:complete
MDIFGWIYTVAFGVCYIPQIIKTWRTKKVDDVSIGLFQLSIIGYISAALYVTTNVGANLILLCNYAFGGTCSIFMVYLYYKYK